MRVYDRTLVPGIQESTLELDEREFPERFDDGEFVHLAWKDHTRGRLWAPKHLFDMDVRVFYKPQGNHVILTLGNTGNREKLLEYLRCYQSLLKEPVGSYEFLWEKTKYTLLPSVGTPQKNL